MKKNLMYNCLWQFFLICLLIGIGTNYAFANQNRFPFSTTVKVERTGYGTAYASYNQNANTATDDQRNYDGTGYSWDTYECTTSVNLSASPKTGYRFLRWKDENGQVYSTTPTTTASLSYNGRETGFTNYSDEGWWIFGYRQYSVRKQYTFTAEFALQGNVIARVASGQENVGSAHILEEELRPGGQITLIFPRRSFEMLDIDFADPPEITCIIGRNSLQLISCHKNTGFILSFVTSLKIKSGIMSFSGVS